MSIRNHTSSVPVDRSVSLIERELVRAKAQHISKSYDDNGNLEGIMFQIIVGDMPLSFQLPSKWRLIQKVMLDERKKINKEVERFCLEQSQRTAWKLLYEWVAIQVAMIKLEQADAVEVFLPYAFDGRQTLYQRLSETKFKLLAPSNP